MTTAYAPFTKSRAIFNADETTHVVTGVACDETLDADGEVCDFVAQRPYYEAWSASQFAATGGKSKGNLRLQHNRHTIAGIVTDLRFDTSARAVWLTTEPTPEAWQMVEKGLIGYFSQAGRYVRRWCPTCNNNIPTGTYCDGCAKTVPVRYCAELAEVSYCDRGSNPNATFSFVRSNGAVEVRKARGPAWEWWDRDVFEEPILIPRTEFGDDSTGFETDALPIPSNYTAPSMASINYDSSDDSTGFE